jgi:predicted SnoaL-like aldol condensation-catalyzing enzyme
VEGAERYVEVIATLLKVCPDFTARVAETASAGDCTFLRWIATGTGPEGWFELTGCDRMRLRDGHVCENYVFADHPLFALVAAELTRGA